MDRLGERALYVDPGVNDTLEFKEINLEYVSKAKIIHLTSFVGEKPFKAQMKLLEELPDVEVTLDPGLLYARKGLEKLKPMIRRCLAFMPSEEELKLLTGKDYEGGAEDLVGEGARIVAVKLGSRGCYVTDGRESHLIKPYRVRVVDTTGAGDAFCAGFLYGLVKGKSLRECGMIANFVASRCITKPGARAGLPEFSDLPSKFRCAT